MGDIELQVFADRLKELRSRRGITQKDFADKIGVTPAALSAYENNVKNPSIAVAKRIAEVFHVSIDWLCGLTEKESYNNEIKSYADAIRLLLLIENRLNIEIFSNAEDVEGYERYFFELAFHDSQMDSFLEEWNKMKILHDDNTIDDEVYALWVEKTLKKYDISIDLPFN